MANTNFERVVLQFLKDRLVERHLHRVGLCHLVEKPDLTDGLENHLRAAMLVGCKRYAWDWLGMHLVDVGDRDVPEARWIQSRWDWSQQQVQVTAFKTNAVINVFGLPLFAAATLFHQGQLQDARTLQMFNGISVGSVQRVGQEPGSTVWAPANGAVMCVEGNARMHARPRPRPPAGERRAGREMGDVGRALTSACCYPQCGRTPYGREPLQQARPRDLRICLDFKRPQERRCFFRILPERRSRSAALALNLRVQDKGHRP